MVEDKEVYVLNLIKFKRRFYVSEEFPKVINIVINSRYM